MNTYIYLDLARIAYTEEEKTGLHRRTSKILYVLKVLWEESDETHPLSATRISERLEQYGVDCERKAVYSYMQELEDFGFDLVRDKRGTYLATRYFELPELKLLVDAVQASKFITERKSQELTDKLSGLLSKSESRKLQRQVYTRNRVKTMNESIYYNVDSIYEAMDRDRQVSFCYWNYNEKKEMVPRHEGKCYIVSPWMLLWEKERYYLLAYDKEAEQIKHYRVDKMKEIQVRDASRCGREQFAQLHLAEYRIEMFGMFAGKREQVTLKVANELAGVMIDRFGRDVWIHPADETHFIAVADVMVSKQFYSWLVSFGDKISVRGPEWVVSGYRDLLRSILSGMGTVSACSKEADFKKQNN